MPWASDSGALPLLDEAPGSYSGAVSDDHRRPSPLRGLWSFGAGGLLLIGLLVALHPVTRVEDCPNYAGNGNASAFDDPAWDLYLPVLALGWIVATILEQFLPVTRRGPGDAVARATAAIGIAVVASCCGLGRLLIVCR